MRIISLVIIHCSAVRPDQTSSAAQIDTWHRKRGFHLGIGYHYVVRRDGQIEPGRPEYMVGAHCKNHNAHSIGVCYEGGLDIRGQPADTRTEAQKPTRPIGSGDWPPGPQPLPHLRARPLDGGTLAAP